MGMEIRIKKFCPDMYEDYLFYFDNTAFTDHEEWSACYCLESHLKKEDEEKYNTKEKRREKAMELIKNGIMNGYMIYDGADVVGWCNADDKMNYTPVAYDKEHETDNDEEGKVKVLYCMDIAPAYRGKGIASKVLERVCDDAKNEGYLYVEAYPFLDEKFEYQFHGPAKMYENHGFELVDKKSWFSIMRRKL